MIDLDDLSVYGQLDPDGMRDRIAEMGWQLEEARSLVAAFPPPGEGYGRVRNVVVLGMGGSAIGGDLVRTLAEREMAIPMFVARGYEVPGFVGEESLVIASSHSGNTEETLSATEDALRRGARVIAVTGGGRLAEMGEEKGFPVLRFSYQAQPRAAVGFSFGLLMGLLGKLGHLDVSRLGLDEAIQLAGEASSVLGPDVASNLNPAKQLAMKLFGKLPVVYGAGILSEVARRWKGQFNENAKAWAYFEQLPELNHNAVVGFENPSDLGGRISVVLLSSSSYHPRVAARVKITAQILQRQGVSHQVVEARGNSPVAQMMDSILTGDYASYYLALMYGSDPTPVKVIDFLKSELAAI